MTARTQVTLPAEDDRRAKARAAELGISFAEYIRRLVRADLGEAKARADVEAFFDLGDSGGSDIGAHKDEYIGDAVSALN